MSTDIDITDKDLEVLWQLSATEFLKPGFFGGTDGSHHSGTARKLAKKGLVEIGGYRSYGRRVNKYKRTELGTEVFNKEKHRLPVGPFYR